MRFPFLHANTGCMFAFQTKEDDKAKGKDKRACASWAGLFSKFPQKPHLEASMFLALAGILAQSHPSCKGAWVSISICVGHHYIQISIWIL